MVEASVVTAAAAALGSVVGAAASIATSWLSERTQLIRADAEWKLRERESLYREFITEASCLAIDALTRSLERPDQIMTLYGLLSRIRLISGEEVARQGEVCCRRIIEQYGQANLTTEELRAAIAGSGPDQLDPLKEFSRACRNELLGGRSTRALWRIHQSRLPEPERQTVEV